MRPLRFVGLSDDGASVVLESESGERFCVPNDTALKDALTQVVPPPVRIGAAVATTSTPLSPREIQTRVRAGESAEALAEASGTPLDKVMRFAEPVMQERLRVTDEARRGKARRGGDGALVTFGEFADHRFAAHGVDTHKVIWDAHRRDDGGWTVLASFSANDKEFTARFAFALANRTVGAIDEIASDLLSGGQIRALMPEPPPPVLDTAPAKPARLTPVPDLEPENAADPIPLRSPRRQRAHTRHVPLSVDDELYDAEPELFDQTAFEDWDEPPTAAPRHTDAQARRPAVIETRETHIEVDIVEFDLDIEDVPTRATGPVATPAAVEAAAPTDPPAAVESPAAAPEQPVLEPPAEIPAAEAHPTSHRRKAAEKPKMPSWDDILLGVRRKD